MRFGRRSSPSEPKRRIGNHGSSTSSDHLKHKKAGLEKKMKRERLILGDLPELSIQILELCRERSRVTVAEAAKITGTSRNTIKDHLKALTRAGHLERHGAGRGTWYGQA